MKDIAQEGLDTGMKEADKLLARRVRTGRMSEEKKEAILSAITPTLEYGDEFAEIDVLIEAVVENMDVKHAVLIDAESRMKESAIVCSNTSTLPISKLAEPLARPDQFCGVHFFNPGQSLTTTGFFLSDNA